MRRKKFAKMPLSCFGDNQVFCGPRPWSSRRPAPSPRLHASSGCAETRGTVPAHRGCAPQRGCRPASHRQDETRPPGGKSVEAHGDADHHRHDRQRIQEGREEGCGEAKTPARAAFSTECSAANGEDKQQKLLHKVDPATMKISSSRTSRFDAISVFNMLRAGHSDDHGFQRQQPAGQQRIALQRHRQGKDKLNDQQPPGNEGIQQKITGLTTRNTSKVSLYQSGD